MWVKLLKSLRTAMLHQLFQEESNGEIFNKSQDHHTLSPLEEKAYDP